MREAGLAIGRYLVRYQMWSRPPRVPPPRVTPPLLTFDDRCGYIEPRRSVFLTSRQADAAPMDGVVALGPAEARDR